MICLSIETCFKEASASLFLNGKIFTKEEKRAHNQSNSLSLMVEDLLFENSIKVEDLTHVLTNKGPGSFTGVRIGLSFVEGLCFEGKMQKIYLSSFASSLASLPEIELKKDILVILHAIRGTFYVQKFSPSIKPVSEPEYLSFEKLLKVISEEVEIFGNLEGYDFGKKPILQDAIINSEKLIESFIKFPHLATKDETPLYLRSPIY